MKSKIIRKTVISIFLLLYISITLMCRSNDSTFTREKRVYPSDIIPEIINWKLTLPVDQDGNDNSTEQNYKTRNNHALEIKNLKNFEYRPFFYMENNEVVFKAPCSGATSKNSKYPRSELRQLVGGGSNYWSVYKPQYLQVELRVTHTPINKPEICMTQIHGPVDEPLRVQYNANKGLYIVWNEDNRIYFEDKVPYNLGQKLRITIDVAGGNIKFTIINLDTNKSFSYTWKSSDETGYFKVGCYTQSSIFLEQFKKGFENEPIDAYGEIRVSKIKLEETYN